MPIHRWVFLWPGTGHRSSLRRLYLLVSHPALSLAFLWPDLGLHGPARRLMHAFAWHQSIARVNQQHRRSNKLISESGQDLHALLALVWRCWTKELPETPSTAEEEEEKITTRVWGSIEEERKEESKRGTERTRTDRQVAS